MVNNWRAGNRTIYRLVLTQRGESLQNLRADSPNASVELDHPQVTENVGLSEEVVGAADLGQLAKLVWDDNTAAIFGAIMGFWFGDRMLKRGQQQMAATLAVSQAAAGAK